MRRVVSKFRQKPLVRFTSLLLPQLAFHQLSLPFQVHPLPSPSHPAPRLSFPVGLSESRIYSQVDKKAYSWAEGAFVACLRGRGPGRGKRAANRVATLRFVKVSRQAVDTCET
jgi:hypothetical protein